MAKYLPSREAAVLVWLDHALFTLKGVNNTLIEKGHPGDWSPVNCCSVRQTFPQAVRKPSSESSDSE